MRAAGLSPFALSRPALCVAGLATAACYALNLWIVPASSTSFREYQFEIRNRMAAFLLQEGVFTPISDDLVVYIRTRDRDGALHGILVDDGRQPNAHATIMAENGRLVEGPTGPRVLLLNGSRQEIDRQTGRLDVLTFAQNTIDLAQTGKNGEQRYRDATEMTIGELLDPPPGMVPERDYPKLRVEAHKRLSSPLTALSFTLVALLAVLTGAFQRHGGMVRPLAAVGTVVALLAIGLMVGNLAARDAALIPLVWLVAAAPGLVSAWMLFAPQLYRPAAERSLRPA
jgi:lipopolysaccharide export system permease protein